MTEIEKLKLTVVKEEIEIERLKVGYQEKGVGVNKKFAISNVANLK
ncbi:hypothetical protein [Lacrimispora sp.]